MKLIKQLKKDHFKAGGKSGEGLGQKIKKGGANICQKGLHRVLSSQSTPMHLP